MIDGSVLQSAQRCFEKKSRVVVKMVVSELKMQAVFTRKNKGLSRLYDRKRQVILPRKRFGGKLGVRSAECGIRGV